MKAKNKLIISLLKHRDYNKFSKFIKDQWSHTHIFVYDSTIFDWQHKGSASYHYMAAFLEGDLIGVHGVIPLSHFDSHLPKDQIFLAFWLAIEDRVIGVGLQLYKGILKEYNPRFIGALGVNSKVFPVFKWQGFTTGTMNHHVLLSPYINEFKVAIVPNYYLRDNIKYKKITQTVSHSFVRFDKFKLKRYDTRLIYTHQTPTKSDGYVINRYLEHPIYQYVVYALMKEDTVDALCVIRPVKVKNSVILRFVDYIGPNDLFSKLNNHLLDLLKEYKAEYIDIYSYGLPIDVLHESGFINRNSISNLIIPDYFEPFEKKNVEVNYAYRCLGVNIPVRLFKADGDQDRPSRLL